MARGMPTSWPTRPPLPPKMAFIIQEVVVLVMLEGLNDGLATDFRHSSPITS